MQGLPFLRELSSCVGEVAYARRNSNTGPHTPLKSPHTPVNPATHNTQALVDEPRSSTPQQHSGSECTGCKAERRHALQRVVSHTQHTVHHTVSGGGGRGRGGESGVREQRLEHREVGTEHCAQRLAHSRRQSGGGGGGATGLEITLARVCISVQQ